MPLVYQQNINAATKMGVWHITEPETFFLNHVPLPAGINHWHKRLQHLAGRNLLKALYPDFPLSLIRIADTRKPFLENEDFHFSISHCGDFAAVIVSREYRVGVDLELVQEKIVRIAPKFFTAEEQALFPLGLNEATATLCWSIKEAIFKWYGKGGVDFKKDIKMRKLKGDMFAGKMECNFNETTDLEVHYIYINNNYLTWVLSLS